MNLAFYKKKKMPRLANSIQDSFIKVSKMLQLKESLII